MMKKNLVIILLLFYAIPCFAFDFSPNGKLNFDGTHYNITHHAINQSGIEKYLNDYLNIKLEDNEFTGPSEISKNKFTVRDWLQWGADWEDWPEIRGLYHFYDPLTGYGLYQAPSALYCAKNGANWGWQQARAYYYAALHNMQNQDSMELNFSRTFRALGQIMHLLQDMAVPSHTRNDAHLPFISNQKEMFETYVANNIETLTYNGYALPAFDTFDYYWHTDSGGKGLADFTNRNFLSRNTNLDDNEYACPVAINRATIEEQYVTDRSTNEPTLVYVKYASGNVFDDYTGERKPITHLAAYSFFDYEMREENGHNVYSLDNKCHEEYASFLIPRAVGYSAGLLNYFFRGTLEVMEAVAIDGDESGIKKISAKAVNTTPNDNTPNGEVFAFARYKTGTEPEYSYSVSTSATNESGTPVTSIERSTEAAMIFDFSNKPIPANVKELYLHVVYYGDLGNELATGIAIGMDEVSDLYVLLKSGDYYTVFSSRTSAVVEKLDNPLYGRKDPDGTLLYPDAPMFFQFPVKGQDANDPFYVFKKECLKTESAIQLFEEITDSNLQRFDNNGQELPDAVSEVTRELAEQKYAGHDCLSQTLPWLIPRYDGYDKGWECIFSKHFRLELHASGAWNKINKKEDVVFSSSYESKTSTDNTTMEYRGSWDELNHGTGCSIENPDDEVQCDNYCACLSANATNKFVRKEASGWHDDTVLRIKMINVKKYTPLGILWDVDIKDIDKENNSQGDASLECTYTVNSCGTQTNNRCGAVIYSKTKSVVNNWDTATVTYGQDLERIGEHTNYYYNAIVGSIHADSQQVMQIHYHAMDKQYINSSTRIAPEIHVLAQLNRQEGVYDKANDHINFDTQDGEINKPFGDAIQSLIEYSMSNFYDGTSPRGITASFVIVK